MRAIPMVQELSPADKFAMRLRGFGACLFQAIFVAWIGVFLVSMLLVAGFEKAGVSETILNFAFLWGPAFPGEAILGFLMGFWVNRFLRSKSAQWVWLPAVALAIWGIFSFRPLGAAYGAKYLFGTTCVACADQLLVVIPLVSSIAYSLGTWVALKRNLARPASD